MSPTEGVATVGITYTAMYELKGMRLRMSFARQRGSMPTGVVPEQ